MKILLTGGGTAGHLIPFLAVISELRKRDANDKLEFLLLSPGGEFNGDIEKAGIKIKIIKAGKLRRYFEWENFTDIFRIIIGFCQSLYYIYKFKPDVVFSKGGFASVPPALAARILKIPILTHESDIVPGLANKIISHLANKIFISFKKTEEHFPEKKVIFAGSLIRKDILNGNKKRAKNYFNLKGDLPIILIFGGSQGAKKINEIILKAFPELIKKYQIIHICGTKNYKKLNFIKATLTDDVSRKFIERYKLYPYLTNEMKDAYALCDIIISRAGANSLLEIIALQKPSVIIPLPNSANNHQLQNARFFAEKETINIIEEKNLSAEKLIIEIDKLLSNNKIKNKMIHNIKTYNAFAKQNAAEIIAGEILEYSKT